MDFDWREYLEISKYLRSCDRIFEGISFSKEAAVRCAISRAYYSAYCHARNYAQYHLGFHPAKKNKWEDHERLRTHFTKRGMTDISGRLQDLREWRNDCDYDNITPPCLMNLDEAINSSAFILGGLKL